MNTERLVFKECAKVLDLCSAICRRGAFWTCEQLRSVDFQLIDEVSLTSFDFRLFGESATGQLTGTCFTSLIRRNRRM